MSAFRQLFIALRKNDSSRQITNLNSLKSETYCLLRSKRYSQINHHLRVHLWVFLLRAAGTLLRLED
jgi:hypothetical protein